MQSNCSVQLQTITVFKIPDIYDLAQMVLSNLSAEDLLSAQSTCRLLESHVHEMKQKWTRGAKNALS